MCAVPLQAVVASHHIVHGIQEGVRNIFSRLLIALPAAHPIADIIALLAALAEVATAQEASTRRAPRHDPPTTTWKSTAEP